MTAADWLRLVFGAMSSPMSVGTALQDINKQGMRDQILQGADKDAIAAQGQLAQQGISLTPEQEKWLDNLISQQNTEADHTFQQGMRDTSLTSAGKQLEGLGLSASGVLNTGGASSGVSSAAASNVKSSISMQKYAQRMGLAKQILSMTSQMASAGIYGNAIASAKKAANVITSSTAHSALGALQASKYYDNQSWDDLIKDLDNGPEDNDMSFI